MNKLWAICIILAILLFITTGYLAYRRSRVVPPSAQVQTTEQANANANTTNGNAALIPPTPPPAPTARAAVVDSTASGTVTDDPNAENQRSARSGVGATEARTNEQNTNTQAQAQSSRDRIAVGTASAAAPSPTEGVTPLGQRSTKYITVRNRTQGRKGNILTHRPLGVSWTLPDRWQFTDVWEKTGNTNQPEFALLTFASNNIPTPRALPVDAFRVSLQQLKKPNNPEGTRYEAYRKYAENYKSLEKVTTQPLFGIGTFLIHGARTGSYREIDPTDSTTNIFEIFALTNNEALLYIRAQLHEDTSGTMRGFLDSVVKTISIDKELE